MKTATAFIAFIAAAHPSTILKHSSGFDDCAFGLFAVSIRKYSGLHHVFSSMHDEVVTELNKSPGSTEQLEQLHAFITKINDSRAMAKVAPTMGHLIKYMDTGFPLIRSLVTT